MQFSKISNMVNAQDVELQLIDMHNFVLKNDSAPGKFKNNRRNKDNFVSANCFGIDIDEGTTYNDVLKTLEELDVNYSLTCSPNHQKIKKDGESKRDRLRIILPTKDVIKSAKEYEEGIQAIRLKFFPSMDKQAMDASRFFRASASEYNKKQSKVVTNKRNLDHKNDLTLLLSEALFTQDDLESEIDRFINNPKHYIDNGQWNNLMSRTALSLASKGTEKIEIINFLQKLADYPLDKSDLRAIDCAFEKGSRSFKIRTNKSINRFRTIFEVLNLHLDKIHILENTDKSRLILHECEKEVQYISNNATENIFIKEMNELNLFKSNNDAKEQMKFYIANKAPLDSEPPLISFKHQNILSFKKIDAKPEEGPCPNFMNFINRCSNPDEVCAFFGSVVIPESDTQQYLWIKGEGGDGKGAMNRFMDRLLGNVSVSETSTGLRSDTHYTSNFLGKRLIQYPDNQYSRLPKEDIFKMLTGGDPLKFNPKYQQPFTKKLKVKVIVYSNCLPEISSQKSDLRRAIICEVNGFDHDPDPEYEEKLWSERNAIIAHCIKKYKQLSTKNGTIKIAKNFNKLIAEEAELKFSSILNSIFIIDKMGSINRDDFYESLIETCKNRQIKYKDFKEWLKRTHSVSEKRIGGIRKIIGLTFKSPPYPDITKKEINLIKNKYQDY